MPLYPNRNAAKKQLIRIFADSYKIIRIKRADNVTERRPYTRRYNHHPATIHIADAGRIAFTTML
jgi:hypothetical protein